MIVRTHRTTKKTPVIKEESKVEKKVVEKKQPVIIKKSEPVILPIKEEDEADKILEQVLQNEE